MGWLAGHSSLLGPTAARAAIMYLAALFGLRLAQRRTLAQWTAIDFAAAVAVGSIVGRTALASDQDVAMGLVALAVILVAHWIMAMARFRPAVARFIDHRVRVLVVDGQLQIGQLRRCGLTENDVFAQLRQKGVYSLDGLRYVLYETKGGLTVVPRSVPSETELVAAGLHSAVLPDPVTDPVPHSGAPGPA